MTRDTQEISRSQETLARVGAKLLQWIAFTSTLTFTQPQIIQEILSTEGLSNVDGNNLVLDTGASVVISLQGEFHGPATVKDDPTKERLVVKTVDGTEEIGTTPTRLEFGGRTITAVRN